MGPRRQNYNKGRWQVERERLRIAGNEPFRGVKDPEKAETIVTNLLARLGMGKS